MQTGNKLIALVNTLYQRIPLFLTLLPSFLFFLFSFPSFSLLSLSLSSSSSFFVLLIAVGGTESFFETENLVI